MEKIYENKVKSNNHCLPFIHGDILIFQEISSHSGRGYLNFINLFSGDSSSIEIKGIITNIYTIKKKIILIEYFSHKIELININNRVIVDSWISDGINLRKQTKFSVTCNSEIILASKKIGLLKYERGVFHLNKQIFKPLPNKFIASTIIDNFIFGIDREKNLLAKFDIRTLKVIWITEIMNQEVNLILTILGEIGGGLIVHDKKLNILFYIDVETGTLKWKKELDSLMLKFTLTSKSPHHVKMNYNLGIDKKNGKIYFISYYNLFEFDVEKADMTFFKSLIGILKIKDFISNHGKLYFQGVQKNIPCIGAFNTQSKDLDWNYSFDYDLVSYPTFFSKYLLVRGLYNQIIVFKETNDIVL